MALYRLEVCGKQAKLGVVLTGEHAVTCKDVKLIPLPNQVLPSYSQNKISTSPELATYTLV